MQSGRYRGLSVPDEHVQAFFFLQRDFSSQDVVELSQVRILRNFIADVSAVDCGVGAGQSYYREFALLQNAFGSLFT